MPPAVRRNLIRLHRWIGLILAPIFLVIILSGTVLSFRPILATATAETSGSVDAPALAALVAKLEARGQLTGVSVTDGGRAVNVSARTPDLSGQWDIASVTRTGAAAGGPDIFRIAENLHKSLLLGLGLVVEVATFAMLAIMVAGPFLMWLRFRNSLMGWHLAVGWCLLPLTLLSPLTAVLMILGVGQGARPQLPRLEKPVAISQALTVAAQKMDLSTLSMARRFRGGTVMLRTAGEAGGLFVVTDKNATRLTGGPGLVKQIHEGTWAGAWSGVLNVLVSLALLTLTVTGVLSWFARRRRRRASRRAVPAPSPA